ncbi:DegT/DnrJ/EryC1/StrS family aminotransferase, partial [bacterium]|nr:DegT/DnrJ/EryC1/StrS family aminotransferase [bacterium]MBU1918454.1 DegT/DnrJ/EryC1/StrS family aminotransferase [bacterium]
IISSHTMIATASAVHFSGAVPVPVEAGYDHMMSPESIEKAITPKTKVILPTQLNGRTCNMDAIIDVAKRHGLQIFEDAAQALGSKFKGKCAGTFGVGACISFYPAKVLGCLGDAGAVLTNDENIYHKLIRLRDHGRGPDGEITMWGFNSRLDNLQAAILSYYFKKYQQVVNRRREIAGMYQEQLGGLSQLVLPPSPLDNPDHFDVYQNYEIEAERRDELKAYLTEKGVGTLVQWGGTAVHQFKALGFQQHLPQTDRLFKRMLMIPMNMSLTNDQVIFVCDTIKKFYCD